MLLNHLIYDCKINCTALILVLNNRKLFQTVRPGFAHNMLGNASLIVEVDNEYKANFRSKGFLRWLDKDNLTHQEALSGDVGVSASTNRAS